jgi:methylmalonyl-CoA/ethylmalonyl-CoA epimerase
MSTTLTPILGSITELCIVTPSYKKTIDGLSKLGIGPFQIFHFNSSTCQNRSFHGQASDFELYACFAKQGFLAIEIMQPTSGTSLMSEYLDRHGGKEGIQHVAFDMGNIPMSGRVEKMKERGFQPAMEGVWMGKKGVCRFVFFDTEGVTGTVFETIDFSEDWEDPECEWYPKAPDGDEGVEEVV